MAKCECSLTPILAFAGLLGLGAAGYRVADGGCLMCHGSGDSAAIVSTSGAGVATECPAMSHGQMGHTKLAADHEGSACCAGMTEAECKAKMGECPAQGSCCGQKNRADAIVAPDKVASTGK